MIKKTILPTDSKLEEEKGRVALWLDQEDIKWLSGHCCCVDTASTEQKERCLRIRFRAGTALHKNVR